MIYYPLAEIRFLKACPRSASSKTTKFSGPGDSAACRCQSSRMDFTLRLPIGRRKHQMIMILTNPTSDIWILRLTWLTWFREDCAAVAHPTEISLKLWRKSPKFFWQQATQCCEFYFIVDKLPLLLLKICWITFLMLKVAIYQFITIFH